MRRGFLIAVLFCTSQASALAVALPARSEQATALPVGAAADRKLAVDLSAPPLFPINRVVAIIRSKLGDAEIRSRADTDDVAALEALYLRRTGRPLWIREGGSR
jgi:hypothetical protein